MSTLDRLKELNANGTSGPWYYRENAQRELEQGAVEFDGTYGRTPIFLGDAFWSHSDSQLIVEMRNALPKLLAVAR
jgi:hypothetical protein